MSSISESKIQLTEWGHAVNGAVSMATGLIPTQPLFTIKTYIMMEQKIPPIHRFWSGYFPNAGSGVVTEAIAFATHHLGTKIIHKQDSDLSDAQNLGLSIVAGSLGAPVNSSLEHGMIRQQLQGGKFFTHIHEIYQSAGVTGIFKGTMATAGRDALFNCGVFAFNDYAKKTVSPYISDPFIRDFAAGMLSGITAGALSTPLDLGKTLMQGDAKGEYPTFRETARKIVAKGGVKALFAGGSANALMTGSLICATAMLKERVPSYFPDRLKENY